MTAVPDETGDVTTLLSAWRDGDAAAANALITRIYPVLHDIARAQLLREGGHMTLRATELAHEAYERLLPQAHVEWQNRKHFFAIAATAMRRVLVDHVRARGASKRGGDGAFLFVPIQDVDEDSLPTQGDQVDWVAVDEALTRLGAKDPVCAKVVELKLFSGLEVAEIADALELSTATIGRHWRFARAWLADQLGVAGKPNAAPDDH